MNQLLLNIVIKLGIAFFFIPIGLVSQVDSLKKVVKTLPNNEEKVNTYKNIAFHYNYDKPDLCLKYCDTIEQLSIAINFPKGLSKANYLRGVAYYNQGAYLEALDFTQKAVDGMMNLGDSLGVAISYGMMGSIYSNMGLYHKAADKLILSAEMSERINDSIGVAISHQNLGNVFLKLEDKVSAKEYFQKAIPIYEKYELSGYLANTYNSMVNVEDNPKQKLLLLEKALSYAQESEELLASIYHNLASYYFSFTDEKRKAITYCQRSLAIAEKSEDNFQIIENYVSLGEFYKAFNMPDSAVYYLKIGVEKAEKFGIRKEMLDGYYVLYEYYQENGNLAKSLSYLKTVLVLRDSIYNEKTTEQIQQNAAKFEFEKKERKLAEQRLQITEQDNLRRQIILLALLALALMAGIYQLYLYRQQLKNRQTDFALVQQQAETQKLIELDQLKSNFFTNISHELRTPLTLILAPTADAIEQTKSNSLKEKLRIVQSNGQNLLNLVNEIMDLSKMEAGKLDAHPQKIILKPLIKRLFYAFESLAELRNLDYKLIDEIPHELSINIDIEKFEKILNNLLSNALKYTAPGDKVQLKIQETTHGLIFEVSDTGTGIHPDDQAYIFKRFYQARNEKVPLQGGTGVGLALAKELTELLGGKLTFKSEWEKGSSFTFDLTTEKVIISSKELVTDLEVSEKEKSIFLPEFQPLFIHDEKPRLLIVEDNPEMSRYLEQSLSEYYHCTTAPNGQEALKKLKLFDFHCITSDVMMPTMDGFEFRRQVNQNPEWKQIPFLLLTARYLESDKIKGFQLGIDDYVTKPFSSKELKARIYNLIRNKIERDDFLKTELDQVISTPADLSVEQQLLQKAEQIILKNLDDTDFKVTDLANALANSPKQLGRIIKKSSGLSSVAFILEIRLQKARELLEKRNFATVTEVMYEVGIQSTSYFTRKFTERFGKNPSEIL